MVWKGLSGLFWLRWAANASRLRRARSRTSTVAVISSSGVPVTQERLAVDAEYLVRPPQLLGADLGQAGARLGLVHVVDLPFLAPSGGHEHHPVPGLVGPHHDPTRRDRLVVGVGVDQE